MSRELEANEYIILLFIPPMFTQPPLLLGCSLLLSTLNALQRHCISDVLLLLLVTVALSFTWSSESVFSYIRFSVNRDLVIFMCA